MWYFCLISYLALCLSLSLYFSPLSSMSSMFMIFPRCIYLSLSLVCPVNLPLFVYRCTEASFGVKCDLDPVKAWTLDQNSARLSTWVDSLQHLAIWLFAPGMVRTSFCVASDLPKRWCCAKKKVVLVWNVSVHTYCRRCWKTCSREQCILCKGSVWRSFGITDTCCGTVSWFEKPLGMKALRVRTGMMYKEW